MAALSVSSMRLSSMRVVKCCVSDKNDKIPTTVSTGREKKIQPAMRRKIFTPIEPFTTWEKEEITGFLMPGELTPEEAAKKKKAEYNLHMKNLCRGGKLKEAYDLLKEDTPDTETYGYLILGHFRKGEIEEAMDLLRRTKSIPGCEPDARIYGALVKGFCNKELPEKGVQMMEEMIQRGLRPTPKSVVVLVYALCKAGYYSSATDLVHVTLQPTLSYYKVLINALEKAGELGIAKDVLKLMRERGVPGCEPDAVKGLSRKELLKRLFTALKKVGALGKSGELDIEKAGELDIEKAGELDIAKDILKLMQERKGKGLHPDFKSLNKSSIPRKERQGKGKRLKKSTPEEAAKKSKANYNFAVKYWCSSGNLKKAYDYLKLDDPDRTTYSYLILGHFYKGEIEEAMDLFCKTKSIPGCEPDAVTYGAVVKGFCHNELAEKGLQMTREMIQSGLTPTPKTILVLVNALCKAGYYSSATDLVHVTLQPSLLYYNFLIRALEKAGEPGIAKDILNLMQERGVDPDFTSYTGVVMSFVGKGLYFEAGRVAEEMKAKGIDNIKQMKEIQDGDGDGDGKQEALAVQ